MTIEERLQSATMLTDEARERVRKRWEHLVNASEQEILDHCLFFEGMQQGNSLVHKEKELLNRRIDEINRILIETDGQAEKLMWQTQQQQQEIAKLKQDVEYWKNKYYRS